MDEKEKVLIETEIGGLIVLAVIVLLWPVLIATIKASPYYAGIGGVLDNGISILRSIIGTLTGLSLPLSLFFVIVIVYCTEQLKVIRDKEKQMYDTKTEPAYETGLPESGDTALAHRWDMVQQHIVSNNPNDWKQAIIDADIILDDILTKLGYQGLNTGEKLKRVEEGDMKHLRDAWDAHMVRNKIAHVGSAYDINQVDAQHTISLYKKVFEEFFYI